MTPKPVNVDQILDECLLEVAAGHLSVRECLERHPEVADQLAPLLTTAAQVSALPKQPQLSADKRRAIEQQLLNRAVQLKSAANVSLPVVPRPRSGRLRWGVLALIVGCLLVVSLSAVTASATSLPTDLLYPVKRLSEQVSLATATDSGRANLHVELAQRRLAEFETLSARNDVRTTLLAEASADLSAALQFAGTLPVDQKQLVAAAVVRLTDVQTTLATNAAVTAPLAVRAGLEVNVSAAAATRQQALQLVNSQPTAEAATPIAPTQTNTATMTPGTTVALTPTASATAPELTDTPSALPTVKPTDRPTTTSKPAITPPGLIKTPNTPPGQVKTPKPDTSPPGQSNKTPKPKK